MAFISELHYRGTDLDTTGNEFIEITLGPGEDPADFVVSFYDINGNLTEITAPGVTGGEGNLSSYTGVADPEHPGYTIYTITSTAADREMFNGAKSNDPGEANHVALTNITTGTVIDAYSVRRNNITTLQDGVAAGATTTQTGPAGPGQTIQIDSERNITSGSRTTNDADIVCFTQGTRIRTPQGDAAVDALRCGDIVLTADGAAQPIRWIGSWHVSRAAMETNPTLRPIRIAAGALGPNLPAADLLVSRQHRMLVRSRIAQRMFEVPEVLVSAIKLTALPGVQIDTPKQGVAYYHILLDQHEVLVAEGAPSESLHLGPQTQQNLSAKAWSEINAVLPETRRDKTARLSRNTPNGARQRQLIERHVKNRKPVFETGGLT